VKGFLFAVLFFGLILSIIFQEFTHQRDHHAVFETQACLQNIDKVLHLLLFFSIYFDLFSTLAL